MIHIKTYTGMVYMYYYLHNVHNNRVKWSAYASIQQTEQQLK